MSKTVLFFAFLGLTFKPINTSTCTKQPHSPRSEENGHPVLIDFRIPLREQGGDRGSGLAEWDITESKKKNHLKNA